MEISFHLRTEYILVKIFSVTQTQIKGTIVSPSTFLWIYKVKKDFKFEWVV